MSYSKAAAIARLGSMWIDSIPPINLLSVGQFSMLRNQNPFANPEIHFSALSTPTPSPELEQSVRRSALSQAPTMATPLANATTVSSPWADKPPALILQELRSIHEKVQTLVKEQEEADRALEDYLLTPLPSLIKMQWRVFRQNRLITRDPRTLAFLLPAPFDQQLRASEGASLFIEYQRLAFAKASPKEIAESLAAVSLGELK